MTSTTEISTHSQPANEDYRTHIAQNTPTLEILFSEHNGSWQHQLDCGLNPRFYKLVKTMRMGKSSQKCSICLEGFSVDQIIKRMPCGHIFHRQCAKMWLKKSSVCPNCRFDAWTYIQKQEKVSKPKAQQATSSPKPPSPSPNHAPHPEKRS